MTVRMLIRGLFPLFGLLVAAGCSSSSTSPAAQGEVRLVLVDAPAGFEQVNIVVTRVEVHAAGYDSTSGWITVSDTTATYDLLVLTNGANSVLGNDMLPVGKYTQIRLAIGAGSNVVVDGVTYGLDVSSATGLKLNHNFDIKEGVLYEMTLDFDADKSLTLMNNGQYRLQPVIRIIANAVSGTISGVISPGAVRTTITARGLAGDTVATVSAVTNGAFSVVALPAGTYDVTIAPDGSSYLPITLMGVQVTAQQDMDLGTLTLTATP